jgi:type II restriction enzyme
METRRSNWVAELSELSGSFNDDSLELIEGLREEIQDEGNISILQHLRICGAVPEQYRHDSSEEKLYSKYTDAVVSEALRALGLNSTTIKTRSDAADVQARANDYSLVADAKAFRLSRTAKNQKDFKVQAMDGWRGDLDYAVIVGPIYQYLPRTSQIYLQAITRNVCLLSFTHLACLVSLADRRGIAFAEDTFHQILQTVNLLHPSKSAIDYWTEINRTLVNSLSNQVELWEVEKKASLEGLSVAKREAIRYLTSERNRILGLSRREAVEELVRLVGVNARIQRVENIDIGNLLEETENT